LKKTLVLFLLLFLILFPENSGGQENPEDFFCIDIPGFPLCGASSRLDDEGSQVTFHEINLFSGDMDSAWVVGGTGDGIGEKVWFEIEPGLGELLINNGHTMNESSFADNNRVKTAELQIWVAINKPGMVTEIGALFHGYPATTPFIVELEDAHQKQFLEIETNWEKIKEGMEELLDQVREVARNAYLITIEIKEIYPGKSSGNTGVTEISWNLLPEYAGPGGLGIIDLKGIWENEGGSDWDILELESNPYYQGWTAYLDDAVYDAGIWEIGDGMLRLYSDSKMEQFFFSGFPLGYNQILLIGDEGEISFWNKD